jgi:predicted alpha/beta-fold hydrolase
MDAALAALIGGAIGSAASLGGSWIQQYHQSRRDRERVAADLAIANYKQSMEIAGKAGGARVQPLSTFLIYQAEFLELLSKGPITSARVREFKRHYDEISKALSE